MEKENEREFTAVSIPTPLFKEIEKRIRDTDFVSVSNYVTHVLREITAGQPTEKLSTREDEEKVKERLKRLGYL